MGQHYLTSESLSLNRSFPVLSKFNPLSINPIILQNTILVILLIPILRYFGDPDRKTTQPPKDTTTSASGIVNLFNSTMEKLDRIMETPNIDTAHFLIQEKEEEEEDWDEEDMEEEEKEDIAGTEEEA